MNFLFWKELGEWDTNIKRGGKTRVKDKKRKTCLNNFGSNRFKPLMVPTGLNH
jgi:hypothetical protein